LLGTQSIYQAKAVEFVGDVSYEPALLGRDGTYQPINGLYHGVITP
jgi:hypothetical protein